MVGRPFGHHCGGRFVRVLLMTHVYVTYRCTWGRHTHVLSVFTEYAFPLFILLRSLYIGRNTDNIPYIFVNYALSSNTEERYRSRRAQRSTRRILHTSPPPLSPPPASSPPILVPPIIGSHTTADSMEEIRNKGWPIVSSTANHSARVPKAKLEDLA